MHSFFLKYLLLPSHITAFRVHFIIDFVSSDHSTPVDPPSHQAATIADTDMNETVSISQQYKSLVRES